MKTVIGALDFLSFMILMGKVGYCEANLNASELPMFFWAAVCIVLTIALLKTKSGEEDK